MNKMPETSRFKVDKIGSYTWGAVYGLGELVWLGSVSWNWSSLQDRLLRARLCADQSGLNVPSPNPWQELVSQVTYDRSVPGSLVVAQHTG